MSKNAIWAGVVIIIVGGLAWFYFASAPVTPTTDQNTPPPASEGESVQAPTPFPSPTPPAAQNDSTPSASPAQGEERVFIVTGKSFSFSPAAMTVKKGDTVKIVFKNEEGFHDLKIDEFGVATARLQAGGEETITFVADKTGLFEYYCSVGNHRAMGMKGVLIVE